MSQDVLDRIEQEKERYLEELEDYLRIPSISTDPEYADEIRRCSDFLISQFETAGLKAEQIETDGHPLVYAEWLGAPGKPTVLFYGHYDVQPVDPIELWRNPPFEPTREGDDLVARGATDDKGQSFAHLKAVEAILAERGELPVNVKFLIEGEEESGGESIEKFVQKDRGNKLACDAVFVSDSSMYAPGKPSLLYGLKGLAYLEIEVKGPNRDLHSGSFGGAVTNPLNALCEMIGRLRDPETGKILTPGFYDEVRDLEDWEREGFAALPFDSQEYADAIGVPELFGEQGYSTQERAWARPTCDLNGIWGGYQGAGAKTVLPSVANAKLSMRLVPDQDPQTIFERTRDYLLSVAPKGVEVDVTYVHGADPVLINLEGDLVEAASEAMEATWGEVPVRIREGGSIPIVTTFSQVLKVPVLLLGFGLPDDRLHSPNEKINIGNYHQGIRATARFLDVAGRNGSED